MASDFYHFGPFQLDSEKRRLTRQGEVVPLTPKVFDLLLTLVSQKALRKNVDVLTRPELIAQIWPDTSVEEHNLNQCIAVLRKALDDSSRQPNYIATLPGHGYSFIADVRRMPSRPAGGVAPDLSAPSLTEPSPAAVSQPEDPQSPVTSHTSPSRFLVKGSRLYVLAGFVLLLAVVLVPSWRSRVRSAFIPNRSQSVSVLPFASLVADPQDKYVSEGLSEELSAELGQLPALKVVAGPRSDASGSDIRALARLLNVGTVLKGSVRRSGDQYRIAVQLIDGNDGRELWSDVFSGDASTLAAVEDQIVRHTAAALHVSPPATFEQEAARRTSENPEAHELYLQARYLWSKRDLEMDHSLALFQQAIAKDPSYARAYAGLADWYAVTAVNGRMPVREAVPQAKLAAQKALELDPNMAEPHATLGLLKSFIEWDWQGAQDEFDRALALNPGYGTAHHWAGLNLTALGKFAEADTELRKAQELDPLSPMISEGLAENFYYWHRFDDAIQVIERLQTRDQEAQSLTWVPWVLAMVHTAQGQYQNADIDLQQPGSSSTSPDNHALKVALVQALTGNTRDARQTLKRIEGSFRPGNPTAVEIAAVHTALGENEQAMRWLNRAYQEHDPLLAEIQWSPDFDPLKEDASFIALVHRVRKTP
jgi:DNA-binding winged helix-turn-helix (wHTH) protein/TolB-like protein/Tfp pilus assembly protein PilF